MNSNSISNCKQLTKYKFEQPSINSKSTSELTQYTNTEEIIYKPKKTSLEELYMQVLLTNNDINLNESNHDKREISCRNISNNENILNKDNNFQCNKNSNTDFSLYSLSETNRPVYVENKELIFDHENKYHNNIITTNSENNINFLRETNRESAITAVNQSFLSSGAVSKNTDSRSLLRNSSNINRFSQQQHSEQLKRNCWFSKPCVLIRHFCSKHRGSLIAYLIGFTFSLFGSLPVLATFINNSGVKNSAAIIGAGFLGFGLIILLSTTVYCLVSSKFCSCNVCFGCCKRTGRRKIENNDDIDDAVERTEMKRSYVDDENGNTIDKIDEKDEMV